MTVQKAKSITRGFSLHWKFEATIGRPGGKKIEGLVQAATPRKAAAQVKRMGFVRPLISVDVGASVTSGFGWISKQDFDLRDKGRLYRTLGQRLKRDGSLVSALESAQDYLEDGRLKSAVAVLAAQINDGHPVHEGMLSAGFPSRDAMVVRALGESGAMHRAFTDLSAEALARHARNTALSSALRMPIIMVFMVFMALPLFFFGLGPKMSAFFAKLGTRGSSIPDDIKAIYDLVAWANANVVFAVSIWLALGGLGLLAWHSPTWRNLAMRIKTLRDLTEKSEHAALWSVFGLMYGAGIPSQDICETLRPACSLERNKTSLRRMAKHLASGADDGEAVASAGFPRFVVSGYRAAKDSGSVSDGLASFAELLNEDIQILTEKTQGLMQLLSLTIMSLTVLGVFYIVYYPIAGPALNSL
jgi:type II secretory pathway component PulF